MTEVMSTLASRVTKATWVGDSSFLSFFLGKGETRQTSDKPGGHAALGAKLSPVCPLRHHQPAPAVGVMAKSLRRYVGSILGLTRGEGGFLKLELELELEPG